MKEGGSGTDEGKKKKNRLVKINKLYNWNSNIDIYINMYNKLYNKNNGSGKELRATRKNNNNQIIKRKRKYKPLPIYKKGGFRKCGK